jgi:hypothetical protein
VEHLAHFNKSMSLAAWNDLEMDAIDHLIEFVAGKLPVVFENQGDGVLYELKVPGNNQICK